MGRKSKFWLIVHGGAGGMETLTIDLAAGGKSLPVFSFEDEAAMFLGLGGLDGDWRVRVAAAGELISILFGPCAGVGRVVLDPLPDPCGALNDLVSVDREVFMKFIEATPRPGLDRPSGIAGRRGRRTIGLREEASV